MGQFLVIGNNNIEKKKKVVNLVIEEFYDQFFPKTTEWRKLKFYYAVCRTIHEINKRAGGTQLALPSEATIDELHGQNKEETKKKFGEMLEEVWSSTSIMGKGGARDMLLYVFGVPAMALLIKQRLLPKAPIRDEYLIPGVTSTTVLVLAILKKI